MNGGGGYLDLFSGNGGGGGYTGILMVSSSRSSSAAHYNYKTYLVMGRGTDHTATQIGTKTSGAGAPFTLSVPANGLFRITNTDTNACIISIAWYGNNGG